MKGAASRKNNSCCLSDAAPDAQNDTGDNAGSRRGQNHFGYCLPPGAPQGIADQAIGSRDALDRFFTGSDNSRQDHKSQSQSPA